MLRILTLWLLVSALPLSPTVATAQTAPAKVDDQKSPDKPPEFTSAAAAQVLDHLRQGLEGYNRRRLLQCFASAQASFPSLRDQVEILFQKYDSFRVRHRLLETAVEEGRGVVLAEFEVEATPRAGDRPDVRRRDQVRLVVQWNGKVWQITDFNPQDLFSF